MAIVESKYSRHLSWTRQFMASISSALENLGLVSLGMILGLTDNWIPLAYIRFKNDAPFPAKISICKERLIDGNYNYILSLLRVFVDLKHNLDDILRQKL